MRHADGKKIQFHAVVGETIRAAREAAGLSGPELARRCDMSRSHLEHIETGITPCTLYAAAQIAHELDVTLDALVPVEVEA